MTFGQVRGWAFGLLHIPRSEFYLMRPGEFWEALEAHIQEKENITLTVVQYVDQ